MVYYNPEVMACPSGPVFHNIHEVTMDNPLYTKLVREAYESRAKAEAENVTGLVLYIDDGVLYAADSTSSSDYKPLRASVLPREICLGDKCFAHFIREEDALFWTLQLCMPNKGVVYSEETGVWIVQYTRP